MANNEKEMTFYFDRRGVRVTNARLAVGRTVYAMANVTSVTVRKHYGWGPFTLIFGAILVLIALGTGAGPERAGIGFFGALLALIGAFATARPKHDLQISTSAGEVSALSSRKEGYIEGIAHAIEEAMIQRG